ncbi:RNA-binding cell elongation regulator Jag/EloR [Natranaerofaba carboxydovora]|uniref:RNA-binding cell elongation regulator Jag/EloR n=1 Tax=Natranaerofaba carboxydovora TaxID=2742683 RepID=UPI001F140123|nr:RNA-binding cell elongation regulator Jag/EloR [Natranaerofaba carboxydovora]UMZ75183.1 hypothetical protein ACONDI_02798 [Natranaerofaba carboxydovora]
MNYAKGTGKTKEEAIEAGLKQLGASIEDVEVEVISEAKSGFLGMIGSKPAVVEIRRKPDPDVIGREFLFELFTKMDVPVEIEVKEKDSNLVNFELKGENIGILIGKRGQTLDSIQYLTNIYVKRKCGNNSRVVLDAASYREKRKKTLEQLAENLAKKVKTKKRKVKLEPMNRYERKIIHTRLQEYPDIKTYSEGEEPNRKVVIDTKK